MHLAEGWRQAYLNLEGQKADSVRNVSDSL